MLIALLFEPVGSVVAMPHWSHSLESLISVLAVEVFPSSRRAIRD